MMLAALQHITKSYEQPGSSISNLVLDDVSLQIAPQQKIAIVGPSGSGKSTLLNILGTLDRPSSGSAILNGVAVEHMDTNQLAGLRSTFLGFVFQMHYLLPQLTLVENVMLPLMPLQDKHILKHRQERALYLIGRAGLSAHLHQYPAQLSVGECQRTAVVRALVNEPRLLLADEPTGSLDAVYANLLADLLCELNAEEKVALLVVTHATELASRMDVIYRLREGKLTQASL